MMFGPTFGICNNRDYFALWAYYSNTALKKLHPSRYKYIVIVRKINLLGEPKRNKKRVEILLLWQKSLDVVVDQCDKDSLVLSALENVVAVHVAWVKPGIVRRCELATALICASYVEQTSCSHTHTHTRRARAQYNTTWNLYRTKCQGAL